MPPQERRSYRDRFSDETDQILFFALFVAGSLWIVLLKGFGFGQLAATLGPVILLVLYAGVCWWTERYRLREDRIGDNIYYLGFLYTLVSLAHALYSYNIDDSGITQIITNFGIAIATTIIGLAGRVLFAQMRVDPVEYEREARHSLSEAINSMRSQLGDISTETSIFKQKLFQIIEEGVTESSREAQTSLRENVERFGATSNSVVARIDEAFARFAEHSANLNKIAVESATVLQDFLDRIKLIDVSPQMLQAKFDPVVQALSTAAEETANLNSVQTDSLKRIQEFMDAFKASAEELQRSNRETHGAIGSLLFDATTKMKNAGAAAELLTKSLGRTHDAIAGGVGQDGEHKEGLGSAFETTLQISLDSHRGAMEDISKAIKDDLATATRHRREIEKVLIESRKSLQELELSLVSLVKLLTERAGAR